MISMQDARFYTDTLSIKDAEGNVPSEIADKHEIALGLYRRRGHGGVPDYVMMMIATEYLASLQAVEPKKQEAIEPPKKVEVSNNVNNGKR